MPMRDYRCGLCGSTFEALSRSRAMTVRPCPSCGGVAHPLLSVFGLKVYKVDRSNFATIAPQDENGKPRTLVETQRLKEVDAYRPGEVERMKRHERDLNEHRVYTLRERAKREAWREMNDKTRTVING